MSEAISVTQHAENELNRLSTQISPLLTHLSRGLAWVYLLPMGLFLLITTLLTLGLDVLAILPTSTVRVIAFVVAMVVAYTLIRRMEQRYHATALFVMYTAFSRDRRDLRTLLTKSPAAQAEIETKTHALRHSAEQFIQAMHQLHPSMSRLPNEQA